MRLCNEYYYSENCIITDDKTKLREKFGNGDCSLAMSFYLIYSFIYYTSQRGI